MDPSKMSQSQRQSLWEAAGHPGIAPVGYGGESGGGSGGGGNAVADLIKNATAAYTKQLNDYNAKYKQFNDANPFILDDVLASETAKAKQRIDPYYQKTLSDFLTGVNTQRTQGEQDRSKLLSNLSEDTNTYTGQQKQTLEDTLDKTREGFAGNGLYNSGARLTSEGRATADTNANLASSLTNADRSANQINTAADRASQSLDTQTNTEKDRLATNEAADIGTAANTGVTRDQAQRTFNQGQFTGPPPGSDPIGFQNSLYSLLS